MEHITTYLGIDFDPLNPVPILITIEDIAHASFYIFEAEV